jgi:hypothetical protein
MRKGRVLGSASHPGQARRTARKRFLRREKEFAEQRNIFARANYAQARQSKTPCAILVKGLKNWTDAFDKKTAHLLETFGERFFGKKEVPLVDYLRISADISKVSFEREALGELLSMGYTLDLLEVEFDGGEQAKWGRCVWLKDHPSYHVQDEDDLKKMPAWVKSLLRAMFKTETAGEQEFTLLSTQMFASALLKQDARILLHKTLVFRKAVLSPPETREEPKDDTIDEL